MPFALLTIGMILIITGFQNTYAEFGKLVAGDFTGKGNFLYWILAIGVVGAIGYNKTAQPFSRAFIVLLLVVLFLTKGNGFFGRLNSDIQSGSNTTPLPAGGIQTSVTGASTGSAGGGSNIMGNVSSIVEVGLSLL